MFSVLFCSFREIFCGFRMSTDVLFLLKQQQSKADMAARRWVCLGSLPLPSAAVFILDTCGAKEVQAEASWLRASNRCEMALMGRGPRQASSVLEVQVASARQGWDLCQEAGRVPGYLGW